MSWTNEEVTKFQETNTKALADINATLTPPTPGRDKIGIFLFGQVGDLATAMSVLKYRKELWGDSDIIWFANAPNADLLRHSSVNEVRPWPWAGNGLPEGTPDFYPLLCGPNHRLNKELASKYELTADLTDGYFTAPHMMTADQRAGIDYPNCSRKAFGIPADRKWNPILGFSDEEIGHVDRTMVRLPLRRTIMMETFCGSGQSKWDDLMTVKTMEICREAWGSCNFLFASHKNHEQFKDFEGYKSLASFTPRQAALFINYCDLFVGISSGLSVTTSYWGSKPVPKIQYCGSHTCSTVTLSTGEISLVTSDDKPLEASKNEFYNKLKEVISRIA